MLILGLGWCNAGLLGLRPFVREMSVQVHQAVRRLQNDFLP